MKALAVQVAAGVASLALAGCALAPSAFAGNVGSSLAQEQMLADRYAPIVRLVDGHEGCGPGVRDTLRSEGADDRLAAEIGLSA